MYTDVRKRCTSSIKQLCIMQEYFICKCTQTWSRNGIDNNACNFITQIKVICAYPLLMTHRKTFSAQTVLNLLFPADWNCLLQRVFANHEETPHLRRPSQVFHFFFVFSIQFFRNLHTICEIELRSNFCNKFFYDFRILFEKNHPFPTLLKWIEVGEFS